MQRDELPRLAVVGAGAVGCYFGGMLARAGVPVTLIGRPAHMQAIAREGLRLEGLRVRERIRIAVSTSLEAVREAEVVLFCVKTVDTESAAREMRPCLAAGAALLSLQNGVDNVDRIHRAAGLHAIPVAVYVAAAMTAPGQVTHTGRGDLVLGHRAGWPREPDLGPLAAMFESADIPCRVSENIETPLWEKLAINCAYNALSALTRARYGRMAGFEPLRGVMRTVIAETVAVGHAEGAALREPDLVAAAFELGVAMSGALSSTAQDMARGKLTEIDALNGYVSRRGAARGIPTPANDTLWALVKFLEAAGQGTGGTWEEAETTGTNR